MNDMVREAWEVELLGCLAGLVVLAVVFALLYWIIKRID